MTTQERFDKYLQYFIDGNVSLDYLKNIIVKDKILKSDKGKSFPYFPNFLVFDEDLTEDIYDTDYYKINSNTILMTVNAVTNYIQNSLFAQDIALLNDMAVRFTKTININNDANNRLKEELSKLDAIDLALRNQLLEAKKIYTAYDVLMKNVLSQPDPVLAYTQELDEKINQELARQAQIDQEQALRLKTEEEAKIQAIANQKAIEESIAINQQLINSQLVEKQKQAQEEQKKADVEYQEQLIKAGNAINAEKQKENELPTQKSSKLPLVLGLGVLAWIGLQND